MLYYIHKLIYEWGMGMKRISKEAKLELEVKNLRGKNSLLLQEIQVLLEKISVLNTEGDTRFSPMEKQIKNKIESLEKINEIKEKKLEKLLVRDTAKSNKIQELEAEIIGLKKEKEIHILKNERGAGRKQRFTIEEKEEIKEQRNNGKSIKDLARQYKCSVGLICKIIN